MPRLRYFFPQLFASIFIWIACCSSLSAQEEETGAETTPSEEESPEEEGETAEPFVPLEKLVFLDSYTDGEGSVDGVDGVYSVVVSPDGKHVYAASINDDAISVFSRNASSGVLSFTGLVKNGEGGIDCLNGARSVAISPDGRFVYVASMFSNSLTSFSRDSNSGALTYLGCVLDDIDGVDGLDGARSVHISPNGEHIYVGGFDDEAIGIFQRDLSSGAISFLGRLKHGEGSIDGLNGPHFLTVSPDGKSVYVALWDEDAVSRFTRDTTTGLLTYEDKYENGRNQIEGLKGPRSIVFSPKGDFVYIASWNDDAIVTMTRDLETGELNPASIVQNEESGVSGIDGPHSIVVSAEGKFLYVSSFFDDAVTVFSLDGNTGELVYDQSLFNNVENVEKLNGALTVAISGDGEHVYAASLSDRSLVAFSREVIVDPPVFSIQPVAKSIPFGESMAFDARADGFEVKYQWQVNGANISGAISRVLNITSVNQADNGNRYRVVATNLGGSVTSDEVRLTVLPPVTLDAPARLTAVATSDSTAGLVWRDESDNETGFEIQRKTASGDFEIVGKVFSNVTAYEDRSLAPGTTYIYRIRATKGFEISSWSNESVIESFDSAPNKPKNLAVEESTYSHVTLVWNDLSAVEDGYRIQRTKAEDPNAWSSIATVETSVETYEDWSILAEESYSYRVSAYNESGESDYSNTVSVIIESNPVTGITPENRSVPSAESESNLVLVTAAREWDVFSNVDWIEIESPLNGVGRVGDSVSYKVFENPNSDSRIGSLNIGGMWHQVAQESFVESNPAPGLGAFSVNDGAVETDTLNVSLFHSVTGPAPSGYRASENINFSDTDWASYVSLPSFELSLEEGVKQVYFQLRNSEGESLVLSDIITYRKDPDVIKPEEDPDETKLEEASDLETETSGGLGVFIRWSDNSDSEEGYVIERTLSLVEDWIELVRLSENTTEYLDTSAKAGRSYRYRIYAYGEVGDSDPVEIEVEALPESRLVNLSTRGYVGSGDSVMIVGFVMGEGDTSEVYLRAVGPQLETTFSVPNVLPDPSFIVVPQGWQSGDPYFASNNDWGDAYSENDVKAVEDSVGAFSVTESSVEAVSAMEIPHGVFTAVVSGEQESEGVGLTELYSMDLDGAVLKNLSTRGFIGTGDQVMIGGFVISGDVPLPVLIRGLGPDLTKRNVQGTLIDPTLTLYKGKNEIASNDDWEDDQKVELLEVFEKVGASQLGEGASDSALLITLEPGAYTCFLSGKGAEEGVGLFEVYVAR